MFSNFVRIAVVGALALPVTLGISTSADAAAKGYTSCTAMYKTYGYGIKLKGATDKVKAGFSPAPYAKQVSTSVYNASKSLDYDKDKQVCERPKYKNCEKLNATYKHGFGIKGAKDKATKPVTNFTVVEWPLYNTNAHLDRDKDKISCEKK